DDARVPLPVGFQAALVNEGGHGFYRVRYSALLLEALLYQLPAGLSAIERFNLVNDCWAAVLAGLMPLAGYLDLTAHFRGERDKNVWSVLAGSFGVLNRIAEDEDRPKLAALVRDRVGPAVAELGWSTRPGDDELTEQLRGDLLRLIGTLGDDPAAQARAAEVYAAASAPLTLPSPPSEAGEGKVRGAVPASVLAAAVAILAHAGDDARYAEFLSRFRSARTPQEEQRYLYALAG